MESAIVELYELDGILDALLLGEGAHLLGVKVPHDLNTIFGAVAHDINIY